ncbi:MAG: 16S rRNA (cytidine(1402)-2'-O)-methyltransferase [Patescibacteria group bacterium]|nr:16S rRNA (cytidine(1402)-2'-O)-methyltransferase [Patescibacteria group bacterium]
MKNSLYIVGTPIGNLRDITERAKEVLKEVDIVLCEDTRVTAKLLSAFGINTPTQTIQQHSTDKELQKIIESLEEGKSFALVSDAGTPGISDPGGKLVALAVKFGFDVVPIPGVSAVATALSVCGFPADKFSFLSFPPHKKGRKTFFKELNDLEETVVLYESKHRILKTLSELPQNRPMMVGRELTKMHETLYRGTAPQIIEQIEGSSAKGEFTIVLAPKNWIIL